MATLPAGVALSFLVAVTAPNFGGVVIGEATIKEPPANHGTESCCVHGHPLWTRLLPFVVPDSEALDVHLNGLPTGDQRGNPLDHERLGDQSIAGIAVLPGGADRPRFAKCRSAANGRPGASGGYADEARRFPWPLRES